MADRPFRTLRSRLLLSFTAAGVMPLLLLATLFALFSIDYVGRVYTERALQQIVPVASGLEELLLRYRYTAYMLSRDPLVAEVLAASRAPDRRTSLAVYQLLYRTVAGDLDRLSLHLASLTRTPSLSTHRFPAAYRPVAARDGIFRLADAAPERTALYAHAYVNEQGEVVNLSLAKAVEGPDGATVGYVVIDLFKSYLAEITAARNNRFFTDVVITDNTRFVAADLLHAENDGDFGRLPYLSEVDRSTASAAMVDDLVVGCMPIMDGALSVVGSLPTEMPLAGVGRLVTVTAWVVLGTALLAGLLAVWMTRQISGPVHVLAAAMERVERGDLDVEAHTVRRDEIGILFRGFNRMLMEIRELLAKTVEEQKALRAAEIESLQAQINPHFLYNTLGAMKSMAKLRGVPELVTMTTELGRLLRSSVDTAETTATVADSLALIRSFAKIHDLRHPGRYRVVIDVDPAMFDCRVPRLILQPIVENAFVHGLENRVGPGRLTVTGRREKAALVFTVRDDGAGFDPRVLDRSRAHVGLMNVERRLRLLYGDAAALAVESAPGAGCTVTLRLPTGGCGAAP